MLWHSKGDEDVLLFDSQSFIPRLTAPNPNDPYYTSLNIFHTAGYGMTTNNGNCTCYAYGRCYENLKSRPNLCTGNAGLWYPYNQRNGIYPYGKTPRLGAVAAWSSQGAGHVAIVESIKGDTVITSESGWNNFYFKTVTRSASSANFSATSYYTLQGFIYVLPESMTAHTQHIKGGYMGYDQNHPHYNLYECSVCLSRFTDGTTVYVDNCPSCHIHDYHEQVIRPTCTENGYTIKICHCGSSYRDNLTAPLGHSWDSFEVIQQPTPAAPGIQRYTCSRCSATTEFQVPARAESGQCGENVGWTLDTDGTLSITPWDWNPLADMYDYKSGEAPWYPYHDFIKKVVIGKDLGHIGKIGNYAFWNCTNIEEVIISPEVTSIGDFAFGMTKSLHNISIPDSVQAIGEHAFNGTGFVEVVLPNSVTSLGKGAFSHCVYLRAVTLSNGIKTIPIESFNQCYQLESIVIPQGVENVSSFSFRCCTSLRYIVLPESVIDFTNSAVYECPCLEEINVSAENQVYASVDGILYTKDMTELLWCPGAKTSVVIPDGVKIIKNASFWSSESSFGSGNEKREPLLETVVIPASVELIETCAFVKNPYLKSVQFLGDRPEFESIDSRPYYYKEAETDAEIGNFNGSHEDFSIYYYDWNKGWTEDFWQTYRIVPMEHDHQPKEVKGTPPTWTADGTTDCTVCSLCGEVLENFTEIPALRKVPTRPLMVGNTQYDVVDDTVAVTAEVVNKTGKSVPGVLMAAVYVDGKLAGIHVQEFTADSGLTSTELAITSNECSISTDDIVVKIFFLEEGSMCPLTESWTVE